MPIFTDEQLKDSMLKSGALDEIHSWGKDELRKQCFAFLLAYTKSKQELDELKKPKIITGLI